MLNNLYDFHVKLFVYDFVNDLLSDSLLRVNNLKWE